MASDYSVLELVALAVTKILASMHTCISQAVLTPSPSHRKSTHLLHTRTLKTGLRFRLNRSPLSFIPFANKLSVLFAPTTEIQVNIVAANTEITMKHLAAYLLLNLAGNSNPSASDIKGVLSSVGIDADEDRLEKLISELEGKDVNAVCTRWSHNQVQEC